MPDARCQMPDAGCRMPDARCRMPDAGCQMPDAGCQMPDEGTAEALSHGSRKGSVVTIGAFRYLWASPGTSLGLLFLPLALLSGGHAAVRDGAVEIHGGLVSLLLRRCVPLPGGAAALTLGHVVLGRSEAALAESRSHERVHVRQYEHWGPFLIPAYLLSSLFLFLAHRDFYHENPFEREAFSVNKTG